MLHQLSACRFRFPASLDNSGTASVNAGSRLSKLALTGSVLTDVRPAGRFGGAAPGILVAVLLYTPSGYALFRWTARTLAAYALLLSDPCSKRALYTNLIFTIQNHKSILYYTDRRWNLSGGTRCDLIVFCSVKSWRCAYKAGSKILRMERLLLFMCLSTGGHDSNASMAYTYL